MPPEKALTFSERSENLDSQRPTPSALGSVFFSEDILVDVYSSRFVEGRKEPVDGVKTLASIAGCFRSFH